MMTKNVQIRRGCSKDRSFLDHLQLAYPGHLGFMTRPALDWYLEHQHVKLALENGFPAGYILGREKMRSAPHVAPIFQAAVAMDAQRRHIGLALLDQFAAEKRAQGAKIVQCWCAADLEANHFWRAAGFTKVMSRQPENARNRRLILWRKALSQVPRSLLLEPPAAAGHNAQRLERKLPALLSPTGKLRTLSDVLSDEEYNALQLTTAD